MAVEWGPLVPLDDPTVHRDFPRNLSRAITSSDWTYLGTNGRGVASAEDPEALFADLRGYGYEGLHFAIHGTEDLHDWYVGRTGAFADIRSASERAAKAGFFVHWNLYLNRKNVRQVEVLAELANQLYGGVPYLNMLHYRNHPRRRWCEALRPRLREVIDFVPERMLTRMVTSRGGDSIESFTEAAWVEAWHGSVDEKGYRHLFEPTEWPVAPPFEKVCVAITRNREVYLEPICADPMYLGCVSEGRAALVDRLSAQRDPVAGLEQPWPEYLNRDDDDLLHPSGYSVRYKALATALDPDGNRNAPPGRLDYCGHF